MEFDLTRGCRQELEQTLADCERTSAEQRKDIALHIGNCSPPRQLCIKFLRSIFS
jgi:hypothetical protein